MNPWLHSIIQQATADEKPITAVEAASKQQPVAAARATSMATLTELAWPTRKTEAWRYTSLRPLEIAALKLATTAAASDPGAVVAELPAQQDTVDIWVVNGQVHTDLASLQLPEGVSIGQIPANHPSSAPDWLASCYAKIKPQQHVFGTVSDAVATAVIAVDIAANIVWQQPLRIICVTHSGLQSYPRLAVNLGANAQATIIEHLPATAQSQRHAGSFTSLISEYRLGQGSRLTHLRLGLADHSEMSVGGSHFELADNSALDSHFIGFGSQLARTEIDIIHRGENAEARFNSVYVLKGDERLDLRATVEHEQPNSKTAENIRGIAADRAQATFNGRIHIHRDAQKTLAELHNRNLLLSDEAQINTKPELEIYADDVRCAHGATVAEIDGEALFYLTSRGLTEERAMLMLNIGFINELLADIPLEPLRDWLKQLLGQRFLTAGKT